MFELIPPTWLISIAVALVWLYEGIYCKLFRGDARQFEIVKVVPKYGQRYGAMVLYLLGVIETLLGVWVISGKEKFICAIAQTVLLFLLNTNGIIWSRNLIHDPAGMVIKNFAFIVLVWVWTGLSN